MAISLSIIALFKRAWQTLKVVPHSCPAGLKPREIRGFQKGTTSLYLQLCSPLRYRDVQYLFEPLISLSKNPKGQGCCRTLRVCQALLKNASLLNMQLSSCGPYSFSESVSKIPLNNDEESYNQIFKFNHIYREILDMIEKGFVKLALVPPVRFF